MQPRAGSAFADLVAHSLPSRVRQAARRSRGVLARRLPDRSPRPRVHFLMFDGDGIGGVARATINVANALAETHDVEIISLYRRRGHTTFPLDPRVRMRYAVGTRIKRPRYTPEQAELAARPSELRRIADVDGYNTFTALTDRGLRESIGGLRAGDVVVSTRPSLHLAATHFAPDGAVIIGWDHQNFPTRYRHRDSQVARAIDLAMPRLDGYVVLTEADAHDYRKRHRQARIQVIRNSVAWPIVEPAPAHRENVVVAAGRLTAAKGFDRLIDAWAMISDEFPDWACRIYGTGALRGELQRRIDDIGVDVELAGFSDDMQSTLRSAAVLASASRLEGFPMTLIEALSQGTPVVAFDCPRGPAEIIVDGSNGRLVPDGDVAGFTAALREMLGDRDARDRMGRQALKDARQYAVTAIARDWADLIDDLSQGR